MALSNTTSEKSSLPDNSPGVNYLSTTHSSADERKSSINDDEPDGHFHAKVYKRRWWILFVFCFSSASQSALWNTWSPIVDAVLIAYDWQDSFVALLPALSNGGYVLLAFPLMYLVETRDLRFGMIIAVTLLVLAPVAWNIGLPTGQTWLIAIGSLCAGITACITMAAPPLLSVLWFPMSERTTATAFAAMSGYLGTGLSFISSPYISGANITANVTKSDLSPEFVLNLQKGIQNVVYYDTAIAALSFILVILYFPAKPPKPPSKSQTIEREDFWHGIKHLATNPQFWLLNIAYNVPNGAFNAWLPLASINFKSLGVNEVEAGWLGFAGMTSGCAASVAVSMLVDHFKRKVKLFMGAMSICSIAFFAILACIQQSFIPVPDDYILATLYCLCIPISVCLNGVIPLYYELGCEIAYPVHEGLACSFITVINNLFGMTFFLLFLNPTLAHNTEWMTWTGLGACILNLPLLLLLKEHFYRLDVELADSDDECDA